MKRLAWLVFLSLGLQLLPILSGCAPALVVGGAAAGYYVANEERGVGQILDDTSITAAINARYLKESDVSAININVNTHNGVVTLYGSVPSRAVEDKAIQLAKVKGVKRIISKITIVGDQIMD